MESPRATDLTQKALSTRERILDTALSLFSTRGYEQTTMREIAREAGCSLGLAYRYFRSKEEMVLELYRKLALQLKEQAEHLAAGSIADRFQQTMQIMLELMAPHRSTLGALFGAALKPGSPTAVFGEETADIRQQCRNVYLSVVAGSKDAPSEQQRMGDLATVLYGMHLALVFFWLQDVSEGTRKTSELLSFVHDLLSLLRPLLRFPLASRTLTRLVQILGPMLGAA
jgi:AcrR family transcriptional regulator